jgi:hypothetical protein
MTTVWTVAFLIGAAMIVHGVSNGNELGILLGGAVIIGGLLLTQDE